MEAVKPTELGRLVGEGKAQLLCETYVNIKPPMSRIIRESYNVAISDYTIFSDKVLVKGIAEKTFYYEHPHGKQGNNQKEGEETKKEGDEKSQKEEASNKEGKAKEENTNESAAPDEFKCLDSWGQLIDSYSGIVHFHHQAFEFTGTVDIPGILPGDVCTVELAQVKDYDPFVAIGDNNGLISAGKQVFKIDIALKGYKKLA